MMKSAMDWFLNGRQVVVSSPHPAFGISSGDVAVRVAGWKMLGPVGRIVGMVRGVAFWGALTVTTVLFVGCRSEAKESCLSGVETGDTIRVSVDRLMYDQSEPCVAAYGLSVGSSFNISLGSRSTRRADSGGSDYCRSFVGSLELPDFVLSPQASFAATGSTDGVVSARDDGVWQGSCSGVVEFDLSPADAGQRFAIPAHDVAASLRVFVPNAVRVGASCASTYCFVLFFASVEKV